MVHDRRDVPRDLDGVDVVVYGHSHRYSEEWTGDRLWLNPGSCGRARFGGEVTMAKLTVRDGRVLSVRKITFDSTDEYGRGGRILIPRGSMVYTFCRKKGSR